MCLILPQNGKFFSFLIVGSYFQVFAACIYPQLVNSSSLPLDVKERVKFLLGTCAGRSLGKARIFHCYL